jgi:hypothetical protein
MNRNKPLRPAVPPLTPELPLRPAVGVLTLPEAHAEVLNLRRILAAERRTNQRIQRGMGEHLERIQSTLDSVRQMYMSSIALKPGPSERTN